MFEKQNTEHEQKYAKDLKKKYNSALGTTVKD